MSSQEASPIGRAPAFLDALAHLSRLAAIDRPVLVIGERGSGKEMAAARLHYLSSRWRQPLVRVNCAALPESLLDSELFGHEAGAFTGAARRRLGRFEQAEGGTLFLDEIGDMPFSAQSRLLRVLAEGEVLPIGGSVPRKVNFRVLSASHRSLADMVATGTFREDLYYRLNAAILSLPPLCDRDDFPWLLDRLLEKHGEAGRPLRLSDTARMVVLGYHWPGNIRELDNALAFAGALCEGGLITVEDLPDHLSQATRPAIDDSREATLRAVLASCKGNISEAARRLGIDRTTLHRQMRRFGIDRPH